MTPNATDRLPIERIDDIKGLLNDMLKGANAATALLVPLVEAVQTDTPLEDKQLKPVEEAIQEFFSLVGMALSEVLYLQEDVQRLQDKLNALQASTETTQS